VLEAVWKSDQTILSSKDITQSLNARFIALHAKDQVDTFRVILLVVDLLIEASRVNLGLKREVRVGNVVVVVVVQNGSYDVLVELALNVPRSTVVAGLVRCEVYVGELDDNLKLLLFPFKESKMVVELFSGRLELFKVLWFRLPINA
jgi:hypothetical protein